MTQLTRDDIIRSVKDDISLQNYNESKEIEGIKVVKLERFSVEDGTFEELFRINNEGGFVSFPGFKLQQINRSTILPGAVKAWHIHFNQEDIWYIPPEDHMILGLWDLRENSPTKEQTMRIVMGGGSSKLVLIPRGVAHGVVNVAKNKGTVIYFVNNLYQKDNPDEQRLPWDKIGKDFWSMQKG